MKCTRCKKPAPVVTWANWEGKIGLGCDFSVPYCESCKPIDFVLKEFNRQKKVLEGFYGKKKAPE